MCLHFHALIIVLLGKCRTLWGEPERVSVHYISKWAFQSGSNTTVIGLYDLDRAHRYCSNHSNSSMDTFTRQPIVRSNMGAVILCINKFVFDYCSLDLC